MRNEHFQPTIMNIARLRLRYWKKRIRHECKNKQVKIMVYDRIDPLAGGICHHSQFLLSQANQASTVELDHVRIETISKCKYWPSKLVTTYNLNNDINDDLSENNRCILVRLAFEDIINAINSAKPTMQMIKKEL